eukprot:SAG22_NODE_4_length_44774_cov_362.122149_7_plen_71_part_00
MNGAFSAISVGACSATGQGTHVAATACIFARHRSGSAGSCFTRARVVWMLRGATHVSTPRVGRKQGTTCT